LKRILVLFMILAIIFSIIGCSSPSINSSKQPKNQGRTIIDSYGREVEIPEVVERIVPLGNAPRLITYLGLSEKVVGIPQCEHTDSPLMAYAYINRDNWKDLPNVGNDSLGAGEWYPEEILSCQPDIIITNYEKEVANNIQSQTGIPVVSVSTPPLFSEEYNNTLRIIGEACGVSERAETIIKFINSSLEDIKKRTSQIANENKPNVLAAGATFKGSHSIDGIYAKYPVFEILHAKDVAKDISDISTGLMVDREQLLAWDPDMIFFDASSMELVNMDYSEDPTFFHQLKAVKEGQLYQWPNSTWHWSNVEIPLVTAYYVGALLYPEAFDDIEFEKKTAEIFELFLNKSDYLSILEKEDVGYKKVILGE